MAQPQFTRLATFEKRIMAEMAAGILKEEGIPALIQASSTGFFRSMPGYGPHAAHLLVPEDAVDEARDIIAHLLDGGPPDPDDQDA